MLSGFTRMSTNCQKASMTDPYRAPSKLSTPRFDCLRGYNPSR